MNLFYFFYVCLRGKVKKKKSLSQCVSERVPVCVLILTCALFQRDARAQVDVVYPDVSSGAVHKETLHDNLPGRKKKRRRR